MAKAPKSLKNNQIKRWRAKFKKTQKRIITSHKEKYYERYWNLWKKVLELVKVFVKWYGSLLCSARGKEEDYQRDIGKTLERELSFTEWLNLSKASS